MNINTLVNNPYSVRVMYHKPEDNNNRDRDSHRDSHRDIQHL